MPIQLLVSFVAVGGENSMGTLSFSGSAIMQYLLIITLNTVFDLV